MDIMIHLVDFLAPLAGLVDVQSQPQPAFHDFCQIRYQPERQPLLPEKLNLEIG